MTSELSSICPWWNRRAHGEKMAKKMKWSYDHYIDAEIYADPENHIPFLWNHHILEKNADY